MGSAVREFPSHVAYHNQGETVDITPEFRDWLQSEFSNLKEILKEHIRASEAEVVHLRSVTSDLYEKDRATNKHIDDGLNAIRKELETKISSLEAKISAAENKISSTEGSSNTSKYITNIILIVIGIIAGIAGSIIAGG